MFVTLKPLRRAQADRRPGDRPAARQARDDSRRARCSCRRCRTCASADARAARSISTRCRATTSTSSTHWAPTMLREAARRCPASSTSTPTSRTAACRRTLDDRPRHRRRGSASRSQLIDDTLYDAFGQRQVSTMYTPLNQYHVVMEVEPQFSAGPRRRCSTSTCGTPNGAQVPLSAFARLRDRQRRRWR